jgi:heat shock protein HslJ/membrane-bound inhibitor of C-type lysozyme
MKFLLAAVLLALPVLASAQTPPPQGAPQAPPQAPLGTPPGRKVMYTCPGGQDFTAEFSSDQEEVTLMVPGQPDVELSRQNSGSGFVYGDSYYELRGRGREVTLFVRNGGSLRCHASGAPDKPARSYGDGTTTLTLLPDGMFRWRTKTAGSDSQVDHGLWSEEVEGGLRLVLRGGTAQRRSLRQAADGSLVAPDRTLGDLKLAPLPQVDWIDERFQLNGMYWVPPDGGVFTECITGRAFHFLQSPAEDQLEKAWTDRTTARDAWFYASVIARFRPDGKLEAESFLGLKTTETCPPLATAGAALRGTEWRVTDIDGRRVTFDSGRQQPRLMLNEEGRFNGTTGCNTVNGPYKLDTDGLTFGAAQLTRMACPPEQMATETSFLAALAAVTQAQLSATTLDLLDAAGTRRLKLEARGR